MDRAFLKERSYINDRADGFALYLREQVLSENALRLLEQVALQTDIYIFSGVIRNFLLGFDENRDVDVVVRKIGSLKLDSADIKGCQIKKNSFGGFKLIIDNLTIDAWGLENTWGLLEKKMNFTPNSLIKTAFFNFSSIAYDYNERRFIYDETICRFLNSRVMDIVFPLNPNKTLCILNTIYYAKKYKFRIAYTLGKWINQYYNESMHFDEVQRMHFKTKIISDDTKEWFISTIKNVMNTKKLGKNQSIYLDFIQKIYSIE